ncbi:uncharacterized protein RSE6_14811 [Rhynchosporium secalis]|uniref:Trichodiene oxygenase cytochrome P450 n=1 Tax=Rhynchosporium secalis TaxID=38038 RepID=A0A1E1MW54_RHYSE|nr:uncharacterized protein RSE6_14811 [Rhynchosporium secalis]
MASKAHVPVTRGFAAAAESTTCSGDNVPKASELTVKRLSDEAGVLIGAGSDTIRRVLEVLVFHIVDNSYIHRKLQSELSEAMPNRSCILPLPEMERLPYLAAVIQESTRSKTLNWKQKLISEKHCDSPMVYHNALPESQEQSHLTTMARSSYQDSLSAWIQLKDTSKRLQRYNIAFSRGTRQCVGMNLAYAELFLAVSTLFRRYDMQLYKTNIDSVKLSADNFLPTPKPGTQGVRVLIKTRAS